MNKTIIGVVTVLILVGGGALLVSRSNKQNSAPSQTKVTNSTARQSSPVVQKMTNQVVTLTSNGFEPSTITIKTGTNVMWTNKSGETATVNSNPHPQHTDYPPLNLGRFDNGGTVSLTFVKSGRYGYHNHLNPNQTGVVVVE